jgi:hypothetical protein
VIMKNTLNKIKLATIVAFGVMTSNAFACSAPTMADYWGLSAATYLNFPDTANQILTNACIDMSQYKKNKMDEPVFFIYDKTMLNVYRAHGIDVTEFRNKVFKADVLSYVLIRPYLGQKIGQPEKNAVLGYLRPYRSDVNENVFNKDDQTLNLIDHKKQYFTQPNKDLLMALAKLQAAQGTINSDMFLNNDLHYAILTKNADVTKILIDETGGLAKAYLFHFNKDFMTPLHFMFAPNRDEVDTSEQIRLNDYILSQLAPQDKNKLMFMSIKGLNYFEFATLFKSNNPDFYKKLMAKFNVKVDSDKLDKYDDIKPLLEKQMIYLTPIKEMLNT